MQIRSISGSDVTVYRGVDGTTVTDHNIGSTIDIISGTRTPDLPLTGDDALILDGDDFGFNELTSFYQDFKEYSPISGKHLKLLRMMDAVRLPLLAAMCQSKDRKKRNQT